MKLKDEKLLAKLSAGDLISQDVLYCLVSLYNKATEKKVSEGHNADELNHGIAFAELVSYIEEVHIDTL